MEYLHYVMLGIDLFALLMLIIYLLVGFFSGFRRGLVKLLVNLLPLIIFSVCLNPIVNKVEGIKIDSSKLSSMVSEEMLNKVEPEVTLNEGLNIIIVDKVFDGDVKYLEDSKTVELVGELGQTVIRAGIYIIGIIVLMLIIVPILKLIIIGITNLIGFTRKRKGKLGGTLMGLANYAILFIALFVPLYNLVNLASDVTTELVENKEEFKLSEDLTTNLGYVAEMSDDSFVNKTLVRPFNKLFSKNIYPKYISIFGNPFKITNGKIKINLIDEYNNLKELLPVIVHLSQAGIVTETDIDLTKLTDADLDIIKNVLDNTKLINTFLPAAIEIVGFKQKDNPTFTNLDFDALKNADWEKELTNIFKTIDVLKENKFVINKEKFDYLQDGFINFTTDTIKVVASSEVVTMDIVPWAVDMYLNKLEENPDFGIDFDNEKFINANWNVELTAVANAFHEFAMSVKTLKISKDNWQEVLYNSQLESSLKGVVDALLESNLLKEELAPKLIDMFLEKTLQDPKFDFVKDIFSDVKKALDTLQNQLHVLIEVVRDLDALKVFDGVTDITPEMSESLTKLLCDVFDLNIVKGHEQLIIDSVIDLAGARPTLDEYGIVIHYEKVTDYKAEVLNIKDFIMKFMAIKDLDFNNLLTPGATEREHVGELVDAMYKCKLVSDSVFDLVSKVFTDNGYPVSFTPEERAYFETHTFKSELLHIFSLYDRYQIEAAKGDYHNYDANVIYDITVKASEKMLSTKVLCTLLNGTFGAELGINLQTSEDLVNYASLIRDAINAADLLKNGIDLNNKADTDLLVNTIKSLGSNKAAEEVAEKALNKALGTNINCTTEDISECGEILESVIDTYQKSSDQGSFDEADLSKEQINKIKNNSLAKALADQLFGITL